MMRRVIVGAAILLSAACGSQSNAPPPQPTRTRPAPAPDPSADARLAGALRQPFSDASVEAAIEALARAGVATVADDDSGVLQQPSGLAPTKYYRGQVRNMALLLSTWQGTRGDDFDRFVPPIVLGTKSLAMSAVVAGYVAEAPTFGGRLARKLMREVDVHRHGEYRYPTIVLALFLADTLPPAVRRTAVTRPRVMMAGLIAGAAPDPCAASRETLASGAEAIGAAVRDSPLLVTSISRAAGTLLSMSAADARGFFVNPPGSRSGQAAMAALNAFTSLQSLLEQWALEITAEPPAVHYVNHGTPNDGAFRARVIGGADPGWPLSVKSCADAAGFQLPAAPTSSGTSIVWLPGAGFGEHVSETRRDTQFGADSTARLAFHAATESPETHVSGVDATEATISAALLLRNRTKETLRAIFAKLDLASGYFVPDDGQLDVLDRLIAPSADGAVMVVYHRPRQMATATFSRSGLILRAYTCDGVPGPWKYTVHKMRVGATSGTFKVPGSYAWSVPGGASYSASGQVEAVGGKLVFRGAEAFTAPIVFGNVPPCHRREGRRR